MSDFYNGAKLLSLKDLNNENPELYLCTTNRSGGKTTYFGKYCTSQFLKGKGKFGLIYRYNYELDDVADKFFKDLSSLFFHDYTMISERRASGIYHELFLVKREDKIPCGYAITLNSADQIKKNSHQFSDIDRMIFDEFQSETNHYCTDEIKKFISIHTSIARGNGKHCRRVPVYMLSNSVSLINPYYTALGISTRLTPQTKFLRGNGWVLEQGYVEAASKAQKESPFNKAFANSEYYAYNTDNIYLNDNNNFIEKLSGKSNYLGTLIYKGNEYALRDYPELGVIYVSTNVDKTYKTKLSVTINDHGINYVMLKSYSLFLNNMRYFFNKGCVRFQNLLCKECFLTAISF